MDKVENEPVEEILHSGISRKLREQLAAAENGLFMVAIWRIEDGKIVLYRQTQNFPKLDFDSALALLREDLDRERIRTSRPDPPVEVTSLPSSGS